MKNANACAKKLTALLKKLDVPPDPAFPDSDNPVAVLIQSYLLWEAKTPDAIKAYGSIRTAVVDFNDLRVCMPQEVVEMIGVRYPKGADRAQRLRSALRDIYNNEHAVTLDRLKDQGKREVRKYIEDLAAIPPYVANRVLLLSFDAHGIPADEQLREALIAEGAADAEMSVDDLTSWLGRQIKAQEGIEAHRKLQAWVESKGSSRKKGTRKKSTSKKKTTRKKTATRNIGAN